jgi:hypothetical protein
LPAFAVFVGGVGAGPVFLRIRSGNLLGTFREGLPPRHPGHAQSPAPDRRGRDVPNPRGLVPPMPGVVETQTRGVRGTRPGALTGVTWAGWRNTRWRRPGRRPWPGRTQDRLALVTGAADRLQVDQRRCPLGVVLADVDAVARQPRGTGPQIAFKWTVTTGSPWSPGPRKGRDPVTAEDCKRAGPCAGQVQGQRPLPQGQITGNIRRAVVGIEISQRRPPG